MCMLYQNDCILRWSYLALQLAEYRHSALDTDTGMSKRAHEDEAHEQAKRSRRTRWGHDEEEHGKGQEHPRKPLTSPKALSDIVKRLSSVVQEKTAPEELQALAAAASRPLIVSAWKSVPCGRLKLRGLMLWRVL
jgi:hypothetical protein